MTQFLLGCWLGFWEFDDFWLVGGNFSVYLLYTQVDISKVFQLIQN
jgi:hypothetical protein